MKEESEALRPFKLAIADGFCSNGFCGGDKSSAPCGHARVLADIAVEAIDEAGYEIVSKSLAALIKAGMA